MKKLLFLILFLPLFLFGQDRIGSSGKTKTQNVLDVDRTNDIVIFKLNKIAQSTTIADSAFVDTYKIVLTDTTGIGNNPYLVVFSPETMRVYKGYILSVSGDTVTMDTQLDSTFPPGSFADITSTNMNVDGSVTPQTFGLRGVSPSPVGVTVVITRIIFVFQTATAVDLSKFGDIAGGLTRGLVLRVRNGRNYNIDNMKTNRDIASTLFDWTPLAADNPVQGVDGAIARLTFTRIGAGIMLMPGEDFEAIVQDPLQTLTVLEIKAEGYIL